MKIKYKFRKLLRRLGGEPEMTAQMMIELISSLEHTREGECSCDEVYAIADQYAESNLRGEDIERLKPLIHHHLKMCQECEEEYRALLRVLEGSLAN